MSRPPLRLRARTVLAVVGTALALAACTQSAPVERAAWPVRSAVPLDRCDPQALVGWCRVVCVDACLHAAGLGAFDAATLPVPSLSGGVDAGSRVVDAFGLPSAARASDCRFSDDGLLWYEPAASVFPPVMARFVGCRHAHATLVAVADPGLPVWSIPSGPTHTLFVAGSLQDEFSRRGTLEMAALARSAGVPMTWMLGNLAQLRRNRDVYAHNHDAFGDDLQIEPYDDLLRATRAAFPWYRLVATIDGGGHERSIAHDLQMGARAFWGIAWNSSGIDGIADAGAPWGTYCADPASYKRPAPAGCRLVGIEWTARDLTRAYFSGHEEAYSTDTDDLQQRAALAPAAGAAYARAIVDAYAAAGETRPLVMMTQEEAGDAGADPMGSWAILHALYGEARRVGMRTVTMSDSVAAAQGMREQRRAIAFPYVPGLPNVFQGAPGTPAQPYPAIIDYTDRTVDLLFVAGRSTPVRVVPYGLATTSAWNVALPQLPPGEFAVLALAAASDGEIVLRFDAPIAQRFGIAFWTDPATVGWQSAGVVSAGRAGAVAVFDLPEGIRDIRLRCRHCASLTFPLSR